MIEKINPDLFITIQPDSWDKYRENLQKRILTDIETKLSTMGVVWRFIPEEIKKQLYDSTYDRQKFLKSDMFKEALDKAIKHQKDKMTEFIKKYENLKPIILYN